jgi:phosphoglycerate kinase
MEKQSIKDIDLAGKKVLVRVDYNVPMEKDGTIADDTRIVATLPTLRYLLAQKAAIILMAHLGRPKGAPDKEHTLAPVAKYLSGLLGLPVDFATDCVGPAAAAAAKAIQPGQIVMLENLRFHPEEEQNDPTFSKQLASLADVYVNDAFGVSHRAHASVEGITKFLPAVAGLLMEKEIDFLCRAVEHPEHPYVAIIGGAKVSDKIGVIANLLTKVQVLIVGGGMANTFIAAQGFGIGKSLVEIDKLDMARSLLAEAARLGVPFLLPSDVVVADKFAPDAATKVVSVDAIPADWLALDIGPASRKAFAAALVDAKQIIWNGPMGVFEMEAFGKGTEAVAEAVAASKAKAVTIVGGGDSIAAIEKLGLQDRISHISTGGGASLEFLEGKILPGIAAINDKIPGGGKHA